MLIVFEGIDGAGKGRQIMMLCSFLRQQGIRYRLHKYPTKRAKGALLHLSGKKEIAQEKLAKIFAQDILSEQAKIRREIGSGFVVICDRYLHSTLAYQSVGYGYGKLKARLPIKEALVPDLVVLLDISPGISVRRKQAQKKKDRHDSDEKFLSKVRAAYLRMEKENFLAYKYALIDASRSPLEVFAHVVAQVEMLIAKKKG